MYKKVDTGKRKYDKRYIFYSRIHLNLSQDKKKVKKFIKVKKFFTF